MARKQVEDVRLSAELADLWDAQREVLAQAGHVVQEASRKVGQFAGDEVAPRLREAAGVVGHAAAVGVDATRRAASTAKDRIVQDVLPAVATALRSAGAMVEVARQSVARGAKSTGELAKAVVVPEPKKKLGAGAIALMGVGIVFAAGVAYAAWRTFRADDDLWLSEAPVDDAVVEANEDDEFFG